MTAPDAARADVRAELHDVLLARGQADADELSGVLTSFAFVGLDRGGWDVVRRRARTGACPMCRRQVTLAPSGRLWTHGPPHDRCDGSTAWPAPDAEDANAPAEAPTRPLEPRTPPRASSPASDAA